MTSLLMLTISSKNLTLIFGGEGGGGGSNFNPPVDFLLITQKR